MDESVRPDRRLHDLGGAVVSEILVHVVVVDGVTAGGGCGLVVIAGAVTPVLLQLVIVTEVRVGVLRPRPKPQVPTELQILVGLHMALAVVMVGTETQIVRVWVTTRRVQVMALSGVWIVPCVVAVSTVGMGQGVWGVRLGCHFSVTVCYCRFLQVCGLQWQCVGGRFRSLVVQSRATVGGAVLDQVS